MRKVSDQEGLIEHITSFYKNLFGNNEHNYLKLGDDFWSNEDKLNPDFGDKLCEPFSEEEIKKAVFSMKSESAPGPNGFSVQFFKSF